MPIIRSRYQGPDGLMKVENVKDKTVFTHVQNVDGIMKQCQAIRKSGLNRRGTNKLFARIPDLVFYAHPEFGAHGKYNWDAIYRFLDSPDGEAFKTVSGSARHA